MAMELTCPMCGVKIRGATADEVMKNGMEQGKKVGHPDVTDEQMNHLKAQIKKVS
jgi:predicted small metal-binding protein